MINRASLAGTFCLLLVVQLQANNNYYIPGDAFFYSEIDEKEWPAFRDGKLSFLEYDRPDHLPIAFCGYAGFQKLALTDLPDDYRRRLRLAVETVKKNHRPAVEKQDSSEPSEKDPGVSGLFDPSANSDLLANSDAKSIRVFAYNHDFDFSQRRIGIKYNEAWPDEGVKLGISRKHFQFDFFVATAPAILESWRFGSAVRPLDVKLPARARGRSELPIRFEPGKIKFLITPPVPLATLCYPPTDSKVQCVVVSSDKNQTWIVDSSQRKPNWKLAQ